MSRDLIEAGLGWSWTPDKIVRQIRCRDTLVLVAHQKGRLLGFASMGFAQEDAHLNLLCVVQPHQRCGIGRRLIKLLEDTAMVAGIACIHLEVRASNHEARHFYHTLGYETVKQLPRYYRGQESAIRMVHNLRTMRWSEVYKTY
jgi:ribosomal-protein-alanine N-acetyltransferase